MQAIPNQYMWMQNNVRALDKAHYLEIPDQPYQDDEGEWCIWAYDPMGDDREYQCSRLVPCHQTASEPTYDPAAHWGEDYTVIENDDQNNPPSCRHCNGLGYHRGNTYGLPENCYPDSHCDECDGWGCLFIEPPPEPEEIDYELMGVGL